MILSNKRIGGEKMGFNDLFRRKYIGWNEYLDIAKERAIFLNKEELKERRWDYVL